MKWGHETNYEAGRATGAFSPKRPGEVGGPGETRDLRGRAGGRTLVPRVNGSYDNRTVNRSRGQ